MSAKPILRRKETVARIQDRMIRAAKLDAQLYEEVEADQGAMREAMTVVVLSAVAAGIGNVANGGLPGIIVGTIGALAGWYIWAFLTYFIGTSRWTKEVTAAYALGDEYVRRSAQLKRRCFAMAVSSMLVMVGIVALGAAADPATGRTGTAWWATPHMFGAMLGTAWIALSFVTQYNLIRANFGVIADVMQQVESKQHAAQ